MPNLVHIPGPDMGRLKGLVGEWSSPEGSAAFRLGPGGFSLLCDEICRTEDGIELSHGIIAWLPVRRIYEFLLADGGIPGLLRLTGSFAREELVFEGRDERREEAPRHSFRIRYITPESFVMVAEEIGEDGRALSAHHRSYRRKKPAGSG